MKSTSLAHFPPHVIETNTSPISHEFRMAGSSSTTFAVGSVRSGAGEGDEIEWLYAIHDQGPRVFFPNFCFWKFPFLFPHFCLGCFFFFWGGEVLFGESFLRLAVEKGDASSDFGSLVFVGFQATSENLAKISRTLEVRCWER